MQLTDVQYAKVAATLDRCGIRDDDLHTSLQHACRMAGDVDSTQWLTDIKALTDEQITNQYGHDTFRAVKALAVHHKG